MVFYYTPQFSIKILDWSFLPEIGLFLSRQEVCLLCIFAEDKIFFLHYTEITKVMDIIQFSMLQKTIK